MSLSSEICNLHRLLKIGFIENRCQATSSRSCATSSRSCLIPFMCSPKVGHSPFFFDFVYFVSGHLIPFMFTKWLQDTFDVPLVIQVLPKP